MLSASERKHQASLGGHGFIASGGDPAELGRRRQAQLRTQLAAEIDPDGSLLADVLERRLDAAVKLYFGRLAWLSARLRAARKEKNAARGTGILSGGEEVNDRGRTIGATTS